MTAIARLRALYTAAFPDGGAREVMAATMALVDAAPALLDVAEAAREVSTALVDGADSGKRYWTACDALNAALRRLDEAARERAK